MTSKSNLPAEVHDHFRKANVLHTYVQKDLGEAAKHALEIGQELLAAKTAVPHGRWETECTRLFDGSLRTAQFYMQFTKDFGKLKSADAPALLVLEGSLEGVARAARKAAHPEPVAPKQKPTPSAPPKRDGKGKVSPSTPIRGDSDPFDEVGEDGRTDSDGTEPKETPSRPPRKGKDKPAGPPKQYDRSAHYKSWEQSIGPLVRLVDKIAEGVGEKHNPHHEAIHAALNTATEEMMEWMKQ